MISTVVIIGAGELGGALAHKLASRDRFAEIRLIDDNASLAAGKALDIQQSAPIERFRTNLRSSGSPDFAAGARLIVIADASGNPSKEWQDETGLTLIKRLWAAAPNAVFVCAGASQRRLVEMAVREGHLTRARVVGSSPLALASAVRALVALEMNGSAVDISLSVLGIPPSGVVIPWSDATIAGASAHRVLTPVQFARIEARIARLWPPAPYALGSAAARVCEAIAEDGRRVYPCIVGLDGEFGTRGRAAAVPVVLGSQGVARIATPSLSVQEQVAMDNALAGA